MNYLMILAGILWSALAAAAIAPPVAAPTDLTAKAYLLYDYNSGQALLSKNADARIDPAALSKLMTTYLVFDALKHGVLNLSQELTVPGQAEHGLSSGESRMLLRTGDSVSVADLLYGLIVSSGSDAAITLAVKIAGTEELFTKKMNQQATLLGMTHTHFTHPAALPDPQHYSTAKDLVLLAAALIHDFPQYYPMFKEKEFTYNKVKQANRNRLLWLDEFADGLKTGQNATAGFCLIGSSKRDQRRLISVVLGTESDVVRTNESQKLLNYGFQQFDLARLYRKDKAVANVRVWKGIDSEVEVGFRKDMYLTFPKGQQAQLTAKVETYYPVLAPISAGQQLGTLKFFLAGKPYAAFPLTALTGTQPANVFARGWDALRLLVEEWMQPNQEQKP